MDNDEKIVGCGAWGKAPFHYRAWWMGGCVVHEDFRNNGIAEQLIKKRIEIIKKNGGGYILVSPLQHDTQRFLKHGFEVKDNIGDHNILAMEV